MLAMIAVGISLVVGGALTMTSQTEAQGQTRSYKRVWIKTPPAQGQPVGPSANAVGPLSLYLPLVSLPDLPLQLRAAADTDVIEGRPDSNFGSSSSLWIGNHDGFCTDDNFNGGASRGLVRFDLSSVPANRIIAKATLYLHTVGLCWNTRSVAPISISPIIESWSSSTVTWASQPPIGAVVGAVDIPLAFDTPDIYQIDVTGQVQRWMSGAEPNYGLMLHTLEQAGDDFAFVALASSERSESAPYIEVVLAPSVAGAEPLAGSSITAPTGP
jgi:hypothetical protein